MSSTRKPGASSRAMAHAVVGVGYAVISIVVLFFDVMTIKLLFTRFPDGIFRYSAVAGILATGVTIIALVVGKSHWFRPGGQMNWAWIMTGVELAISVVNVIAAFNPDGMAWWVLIMPATPVMAVVTWILMIFFSPERAQVHAEMEMEDEKAKAELDYAKAEHEAHMAVKSEFLKAYRGFLIEETTSPENLAQLREGARRLGKSVISGITGSPIGIPGSRIVESTLSDARGLPSPAQPPAAEPTSEDAPKSIISKIADVVGLGGNKDADPLAQKSLAQEKAIPEPPKTNGNSHQ